MNRNLLTALFTLLLFTGYAQVKFDSGYFVTNDGTRNNCLIKNFDWHFNPTEFSYKQEPNGAVQKAGIDEIKEFGILDFSRYERYAVDLDTSAEETGDLDDNFAPEYKKETVFLKVLVQGKATLYEYRNGNITRYYFKTDTLPLRPLVHKAYLASYDKSDIYENNLFRNQLISALQSPGLNLNRLSRLSYTAASLTGAFETYNRSQHSSGEKIVLKQSKGQFNFNLRLGADLSGLTLNENYSTEPGKAPFGNKISATVGFEAESVLPFNRNKWAIVLQPGYHYYKSDLGAIGNADHKLVQIGLGGREYFFIGKDSKMFATALGFIDLPVGSGKVNYYAYSLGTRVMFSAGVSVGYKYKNKTSIELQYTFGRNILDSYVYFQGLLQTTSLVVAYTIF